MADIYQAMIFYEIKVDYTRQTGEDNPAKVKETYLVEGLNCSDVEQRLQNELKALVFGECETTSCKKVQYYDLIPVANGEWWYKARVELIIVENEKESRKPVNILVQADNMLDAMHTLKQHLASLDCEVISLAKSPVMDVIRAVS